MQGEYYTIFTRIGQAKIANAIALGKAMQIKYMALGDGGGASYEPDVNQTELRREVYRAQVSSVTVSDASINQIRVSMLVPANVGGFTIREVGHFDADGELIAVTKTPEDPKPAIETGAAKDMQYNIDIIVSNTAAIELKVDPTVIIATKAELTAAKTEMQGYTDAATATAVQTANDYADQQDVVIDAKLAVHSNDTAVHITEEERAAWDTKATQEDLQQLAASSVVHYKGFADVNAAYTAATPLVDVVKAMADNSILLAVVEAANDDYPAAGNLQIIKYADSRADCQLRSMDDDGKPELWIAGLTSSDMEQIFGGGGALNKWIKAALGTDLQAVDALQGIVRYPCGSDILAGDPVGITSKNEIVKITDYLSIGALEEKAVTVEDMELEIIAQNIMETKFIQLTETAGVMAYFMQPSGTDDCYLYLCTIGIQSNTAKIIETKQLSYYSVSIYFCIGMLNMDGIHIAVFCDDNLIICTINGTKITETKKLGNPWTANRSTGFKVERINSTQVLGCFTDYADSSFSGKATIITFTSDYQGFSKGNMIKLSEEKFSPTTLIKIDETHYHLLHDVNRMNYITVSGNEIDDITAGTSESSIIVAHQSIGDGRCVILRRNGKLSLMELIGNNYQFQTGKSVEGGITSIGTTEKAIFTQDNFQFNCVFTATVDSKNVLFCCVFHIIDDEIIIDREATQIADFGNCQFIFNMGKYFILTQGQKLYCAQFKGVPGILKCLGIVQKVKNGVASIATKGLSTVNIRKEKAYKVSGLGTYIGENVIEIENVNTRWL